MSDKTVYKSISLSIETYIRDEASLGKVRGLFRFLALLLGGMHAYAAMRSQSMNADGISYLDIGDAYFRGDWPAAINAVWSPLYSWILGLVNFVFDPPMAWQFPVVHAVNFLIYVTALFCFEYMWGSVRPPLPPGERKGIARIPNWLWWTLGYLLFLWTSLSLIQVWSVTPDMLMAALLLVATGLIARIRSGDENWRLFLSLGLVLGLAYLSKTFMFSIALVLLGLAWLVQRRSRTALLRTSLAAGLFLLVSLPFIVLISNKLGKFTIGEAGTVTYVRYVNGIPFPHWQGDPSSGVIPLHPSRIIHESPVVYEFGEPIGGTYPISLDPSYWYAGIQPQFDLKSILMRAFSSGLVYMELFFQKQGVLLACVLALYGLGQKQKHSFLKSLQRWALVLPALAAFALYGTVLVQSRYVGVFILLFWADILANVQLPNAANNRNWLKALCLIASAGLLVNILLFNLEGFLRLNPALESGSVIQNAPSARPLAVANSLVQLGVHPGDKAGVIGYAYDSFWARLARVKIAAEMLDTDAVDLWYGDETLQQSVLNTFAGAGVKAVVAEDVPGGIQLEGWHQVGNSSTYIYMVSGAAIP
jgi:hypothetical protein